MSKRIKPAVVSDDFIGCTLKFLPEDQWHAAAITAIAANPMNAPSFVMPGEVSTPKRIAVLTDKKWPTTGVKLTVQFLDNPDAATRSMILDHMNAWSAYCNVAFVETNQQGQVRIARGNTGYWSYLGMDVLHIPAGQPTMNLQGFTSHTPVSEYKRVVRHETGHTLGFPHEHARAAIVALLNRPAVYAYFKQFQNWDRQEVDDQILTSLDESKLMGTPVDVDSIMTYQFPGSLTLSGQPIPGGLDIDPSDGAFAGSLYPLTVVLPPPAGKWAIDGSLGVTCGNCGHKATITGVVKAT